MSIYALKNIPFKNTTEAYDQWQANHPSEFFFWLLTCKKDDLKRIYPNKSRELLLNYKCNPTLESVLDNWHKNSQFRQGFREWALTNKEIFALNFFLRILKEINEIPRSIRPLTKVLPFPMKK